MIQLTRLHWFYIRSIFQNTVPYYNSEVAKFRLTWSYWTYIRSNFQYTVLNYKSEVAKIR